MKIMTSFGARIKSAWSIAFLVVKLPWMKIPNEPIGIDTDWGFLEFPDRWDKWKVLVYGVAFVEIALILACFGGLVWLLSRLPWGATAIVVLCFIVLFRLSVYKWESETFRCISGLVVFLIPLSMWPLGKIPTWAVIVSWVAIPLIHSSYEVKERERLDKFRAALRSTDGNAKPSEANEPNPSSSQSGNSDGRAG